MEKAQIVSLVFGLTQIVKQWGLPSKYLPLVATVVGAVSQSIIDLGASVYDPATSTITGMLIGLTASGVLGAVKSVSK